MKCSKCNGSGVGTAFARDMKNVCGHCEGSGVEPAAALADVIEKRGLDPHAPAFDDLIEENWKLIVAALRAQPSPARSVAPVTWGRPHVEYVASRGQSKVEFWVSREDGDKIRSGAASPPPAHDGVRAQAFKECAKIAEVYAAQSGPIGAEAADLIAADIRAALASPPAVGGETFHEKAEKVEKLIHQFRKARLCWLIETGAAPGDLRADLTRMAEAEAIVTEIFGSPLASRPPVHSEQALTEYDRLKAQRTEIEDRAKAKAWNHITTCPTCDDLMWFYRGDVVDGPRPPTWDDADYWDFWCYAKAPPLPAAPLPQQGEGT